MNQSIFHNGSCFVSTYFRVLKSCRVLKTLLGRCLLAEFKSNTFQSEVSTTNSLRGDVPTRPSTEGCLRIAKRQHDCLLVPGSESTALYHHLLPYTATYPLTRKSTASYKQTKTLSEWRLMGIFYCMGKQNRSLL